MRTNRSSIFPIVMVVFGALLMIGALLWLIVATRQSATRAAILPTQVVSPVTPVALIGRFFGHSGSHSGYPLSRNQTDQPGRRQGGFRAEVSRLYRCARRTLLFRSAYPWRHLDDLR